MRGRVRHKKQAWQRSKTCDAGACVEIRAELDKVLIRSSSAPGDVTISVSSDAWWKFLADAKSGVFDPAP